MEPQVLAVQFGIRNWIPNSAFSHLYKGPAKIRFRNGSILLIQVVIWTSEGRIEGEVVSDFESRYLGDLSACENLVLEYRCNHWNVCFRNDARNRFKAWNPHRC